GNGSVFGRERGSGIAGSGQLCGKVSNLCGERGILGYQRSLVGDDGGSSGLEIVNGGHDDGLREVDGDVDGGEPAAQDAAHWGQTCDVRGELVAGDGFEPPSSSL